eukprot:767028-Hanusia_phi.AAC.2
MYRPPQIRFLSGCKKDPLQFRGRRPDDLRDQNTVDPEGLMKELHNSSLGETARVRAQARGGDGSAGCQRVQACMEERMFQSTGGDV